jgi:hypothetical protein
MKMNRLALYIPIFLLVLIIVAGAADYSTRTSSCMWCHKEQARFAQWMGKRLVKEKRGFSHELISCAKCHIDGAAEGTLISRLRGLLHTVAYLPGQLDPRRPAIASTLERVRIPSSNCRHCHLASIKRKEVYKRDLTPDIKAIGLRMDHKKHVIASEDTCAKCHERYKKDGEVDKGVNYAEVNHLACDACHISASHSYKAGKRFPMTSEEMEEAMENAWQKMSKNPRWMVLFPSKESCKRCHNGKIHFKTRIFLSSCPTGNDYDNCVKCHPALTPEKFRDLKRAPKKLTRLEHGLE